MGLPHIPDAIAPPGAGQAAALAATLETLARKAGNVHPGASFADVSVVDFLLSAQAIGPVLEQAQQLGLGPAVLAGVQATRQVTRANTNLGILLLLAPLALAEAPVASASHATSDGLRRGVAGVIRQTTIADAEAVYAAIRLARPSGLGRVQAQDITQPPTLPLAQVMQLAADRDLIARQYAHAFTDVFDSGHASLASAVAEGQPLEDALLTTQLRLLAELGDSLIGRKLGPALESEARQRAAAVLAADWPRSANSVTLFRELDAWLRADGNRRNPGAVADLVAASLFIALRCGTIRLPLDIPWTSAVL